MPATQAMIGHGTLFEVHNGAAPGAFVEIAEVNDITPPSETTDVIDATHMQSPNKIREFISGMTDPGEASFDMNFVPGSPSEDLILAWRDGGRRQCRITFPNGATWTFDGLCTGYEPAVPTDDKMTATVTVKVTGVTARADAA